ncbi:hypothetical protein IEQ34_019207 [Dendrobium chrysotoxum]|uniref:Uncharacterized protein n=1 Tax=Dendrobium chrysotoxum TaxID=161865 RepID=A0AAV7G9A6_DENCH|nr:hypothetical protein IEQ34_019207 [Dendrobium chrysotoxum]
MQDITFRFKWLDIHTQDPGKLKDLFILLHVEAEDILRMLNIHDIDTLHYEVYYLAKYVEKEYLFKLLWCIDHEVELTQTFIGWNNKFMKNQQIDRISIELVHAQMMINQYVKDQHILEEKIIALEGRDVVPPGSRNQASLGHLTETVELFRRDPRSPACETPSNFTESIKAIETLNPMVEICWGEAAVGLGLGQVKLERPLEVRQRTFELLLLPPEAGREPTNSFRFLLKRAENPDLLANDPPTKNTD